MQTINVELGARAYPIYIGRNLLDQADLIRPYIRGKKVAIVTNVTVGPLYLERLAAALATRGLEVVKIAIPDGESYKNGETLNQVYDRLLAERCDRQTTLIALGGGVVGDLAGFAAATYQRGVPFIQVPTTLLALVDSSVGGKTAINHPRGKNMIGAFHQPLAVLADVDTLATLPDRELRAGLGEVIKHGLIRDREFFEWLEQNIARLLAKDADALIHAVRRSCEIKAEVVALDEHETGPRALLNLGHTFGHAIENAMGYGVWLHGEAVATGTVLACELSCALGLIERTDVERVVALIRRAGLPVAASGISVQRYLELMSVDKKVAAGKIRFILLERIGSAVIRSDVPQAALERVLAGTA